MLKNKKECGGNGSVTFLRFSKDGQYLASADSLKAVKLFKPHSQGGFRVSMMRCCQRRRSEITKVIQPSICDVHAYVYCIVLLFLIIYYRWLV